MIQFLGLHLGRERAAAVSLGRDLAVWAQGSTHLASVAGEAASGVTEVPPGEWVRSGSYALQEAYFQLPVAARKVWGVGLAGPSGWIALDLHFEPLSPLYLTGAVPVDEDLRRWLQENPRLARRLSVVLSPKDYFRFATSRGLAADVTSASRLGVLQEQASHWSEPAVLDKGLRIEWLPPVFDSHVPTGRLSEEGIRATSLPSGTWLVAGAHEVEAGLLACGDLRQPKLWVNQRPGAPALAAYGVRGLESATELPAWRLYRSAIAGDRVLESEVDAASVDAGEARVLERLAARRRELEASGLPVTDIQQASGAPELGAAALAAIGSGLVKGWDRYYRERPQGSPLEA